MSALAEKQKQEPEVCQEMRENLASLTNLLEIGGHGPNFTEYQIKSMNFSIRQFNGGCCEKCSLCNLVNLHINLLDGEILYDDFEVARDKILKGHTVSDFINSDLSKVEKPKKGKPKKSPMIGFVPMGSHLFGSCIRDALTSHSRFCLEKNIPPDEIDSEEGHDVKKKKERPYRSEVVPEEQLALL